MEEMRDDGKILQRKYQGIHRYIITSAWMGGKQYGCPLFWAAILLFGVLKDQYYNV